MMQARDVPFGLSVVVGATSKVLLLAAVAVACVALAGCGIQANPAATFGSHTITEDEVSEYTASYRMENGLEDDEDWKNYVLLNHQDAKTWREEAIRVLADRMLIRDKAAELGISVNSEAVEGELTEEKQMAGIAIDDDQAWEAHLAEQGLTVQEHRARLEYSSLEEQVYRSELDFTDDKLDEMCTAYLKANYADQVMRHYLAIPFESGEEERALACLEELKGLSGEMLTQRFIELYGEITGEDVTDAGFDVGWDFLYAESRIDPEIHLRSANLGAGVLYDGLLVGGDDKLRVVLCDERVELVNPDYSAIESESFKRIISTYTLATTWASQCSAYLSELEEAAGIQVAPMPDGLPYDVSEANA